MSVSAWRCLLIAGLVLGIGACSWFSDEVPADPALKPSPLPKLAAGSSLKPSWSVRLGGDEDPSLKLAPIEVKGTLYAAGTAGKVLALDAANGKSLWETKLKAPITGGVGEGAGLVLIGTQDGRVIGLHRGTGAVAWEVQVSSEVLAPPISAAGVVVAHSGDGKLHGLAAADGRRLWVYERSVPVLSLRGLGVPVLAEERVINGFDNGKFVALKLADGKPLWEITLAVPRGRTELERLVDLDAVPRVVGDLVYVAGFQGKVAALALDSGRVQWERELSSYAGLDADAEAVFVTDAESNVYALDPESGATLWQQDQLRGRTLTAPTLAGDAVVVGDYQGYVHWLARDDGRLLKRARLSDEPIRAAPRRGAAHLYLQDSGGRLAAYPAN